MKLISDWHRVLTRAWSVKFNLFNALCSGLLTGIWGFTMGWEWYWVTLFVLGAVALSLAPILARILWQDDFHADETQD